MNSKYSKDFSSILGLISIISSVVLIAFFVDQFMGYKFCYCELQLCYSFKMP